MYYIWRPFTLISDSFLLGSPQLSLFNIMAGKKHKKKSSASTSEKSSPSVSSEPPIAPVSASHALVDEAIAVNDASPVKALRTMSFDSAECVEGTQGPAEVKCSGAESESVGGNEYETMRREGIGRAGDRNGGREFGSKAGSSNGFSDSYGNKEGESDSVSNMPLHDTGTNGEVSQGSGSECLEGGGSTDEVVSGAREGTGVRLSDLDSMVRDLKQQLATAEVDSQKLRGELAQANAGRDESKARVREVQGNKTEALMALEQAEKEAARLEEELVSAKEREAGLADELRGKESTILCLQKTLKDLEEGKLKTVTSKMQQMKVELENGKTQLQTSEMERQQEAETMKERLQELERAAASRADEVKAEKERADVAEKKLAEAQAGVAGGDGKGDGNAAEMEKELKTLRDFKETAEDKLKKKQAELESVKR